VSRLRSNFWRSAPANNSSDEGYHSPNGNNAYAREKFAEYGKDGQGRAMPEIRPSLMPNSRRPSKLKMSSETTYHADIEEKAVFAGLMPRRRFDPFVKRPDNIDWI